MSGLWNPYAFTPTGNPAGMVAPPALRVLGGEATAQQRSFAQHKFAQFCMHARLSVVPNPTEQGWLPDGTPYRIVVVGPQTTMEIWPSQKAATGPFIAWTAFFNSAHLPIWDRPVVDFPYDDVPPRPIGPGAAPAYPALASHYGYWEIENYEPTGAVYVDSVARLYVGWAVAGDDSRTLVVTGSLKRTELIENEYFAHDYSNYPFGGGYWTISVRNYDRNGIAPLGDDGGYFHAPTYGSGGIPVYPSFVSTAAMIAAAAAAATAHNANAIAAWESAYATWEAAHIQYLADLAAWEVLRDEMRALQRPYWPVLDVRKAARPAQLSAVKTHLMQGIGDRHLTARLLSFPYNVAHRTVPPVGAGGAISHQWEITSDTERGYKSTLVNAQPHTLFPVFESSSAATYPEHVLRRDLMPPECLFGWTANGEFSHIDRYYAAQVASENFLVAPPGLQGLTVTYAPDYFASTGMVPDSSPGLVIDSDAFIPIGSKFTVVVFEYLMVDPRTGESLWTTSPDVMERDSIWIADGGTYVDTPRFRANAATERVRIAGAYEQTRTGWSTWTAAKVVPVLGNWEADYSLEVLADSPTKAPSAVVVAENLHAAANPAVAQAGGSYLDAAHLWGGDRPAVTAAASAPWVANGATAHQRQFIVRALIAIGKIVP